MRRVKQICISIPAEWVPDLDAAARKMGISRSSYISMLIYQSKKEQPAEVYGLACEEVRQHGEA